MVGHVVHGVIPVFGVLSAGITNAHAVLRQNVTSPGGTTAVAVSSSRRTRK